MNVLDAALSSEWAIEEAALDVMLKIAAREHDLKPEALEAYRAKALEKGERVTKRDGVAIINVEGPLFKKANLMTELCGATSYEQVRRDLQVAVDDGNIRAILLNVDSPGGQVAGVAELAAAVRVARGVKPIIAYAGDVAASAAYWIASAADRIVIGESAAVGSIGVIATIEDARAVKEARGIRTHEFVSSVSPHKASDPAKEEGRVRIQARVDALAEIFVGTVAANRNASRAYVLKHFGGGDVLIGQAAVKAGMADEIGNFESVLAGLAGGRASATFQSPSRASQSPVRHNSADEMAAQAILAARNFALGNLGN